MKIMNSVALVGGLLLSVQTVQAAIALDRTRAIFNGDKKSISLNIKNDSTRLPYLAQAWIEDEHLKKITDPLIVVPPVQRLEPGSKSQVRVTALPAADKLPQDRESVYYFNVREIPPRSEKPNVMQIALQTKIKLFYRPAAIAVEPGTVWQDKIVLTKTAGGYNIENPTPYYVTIVGIAGKANGESAKNFEAAMIAPKSSQKILTPVYDTPYVTYINDYGGHPELKFTCAGNSCHAQPAKI